MRAGLLLLSLAGVSVLNSACDEPGPPVPCEESRLLNMEIHVGESARVAACFTAEALPLTYSVETTPPEIVSVEVTGSTVEISAEAVGQTIVSINATDVNGRTGSQNTRVNVPNRAPLQVAELPLDFPLWSVIELDLNNYFADPDRQPLVFDVRGHDSRQLDVTFRGDTLVLHALEKGETSLRLRVTDTEDETLALDLVPGVGPPWLNVTQGSHSRHNTDVPLVAGRPTLARVFLRTDSFAVAVPDATATILDQNGNVLRTSSLSARGATPARIDESRLDRSLNAEIPPQYLLSGARLVVDIEATKDPAIPRRMEWALNVVQVPVLDLTLVPVVIGNDEDAIETVAEMGRNPLDHRLLYHMRTLLPVDSLVVRVHQPLRISNDINEQRNLIHDLAAIWQMEGRRGLYLGIVPSGLGNGILGQAFLPGGPPVGWSVRQSSIIAHEIGHVFGLRHAPCGATQVLDPEYPYPQGQIGVWGYEFELGRVVPPTTYDIMTYCSPVWISDYHFAKATRFRVDTRSSPVAGRKQRVLAVRGWIDADGKPVFRPAFYTEGTPTRITGDSHVITASGPRGQVFSYSFEPHEIAGGPGGASFFHLVPVTWMEDELTSITVLAPDGGAATLDAITDHATDPLVIRNGEVVRLPGRRR